MGNINTNNINENARKKKLTFKKILPNNTLLLGTLFFLLLLLSLTVILGIGSLNSEKMSQDLRGVYITDIKDRSAVVSWVTITPQKTALLYSKEEISLFSQFTNAKIAYDIRDLEEVGEFEYKLRNRGKYYVHSVVLRELEPETNYYFAIRNGFFLNNSTYINTFTTTSTQTNIETPDVAYGNIYNQDNELISDTLLLFQLTNPDNTNISQQVSYAMDGNTGWSVDLSNLWTEDYQNPYTKDNETFLSIRIINSKEDTTKMVDYDFIKPVENISSYDNSSANNIQINDVLGLFTKQVYAGFLECDSSGGTWSPPNGPCVCQPGYSVDANGYCRSISGTCTRMSGICACNCPSPYTETCTSENCRTTTLNCPRNDNCGASCGNPTTKTCYRPAEQENCGCFCPVRCPSDYPETHNNGNESKTVSNNCNDSCGNPCTRRVTCYKANAQPVVVNGECGGNAKTYSEKSSKWDSHFCDSGVLRSLSPNSSFPSQGGTVTWRCEGSNGGTTASCTANRLEEVKVEAKTKENCTYDPDDNQNYYWCECSSGGVSACVGARELRDSHSSSCLKYCENNQNGEQTGFVKTKFCYTGELRSCTYGCQYRGPTENDICRPRPSDVPQENYCNRATNSVACRYTEGFCEWIDNQCVPKNISPNKIRCADLETRSSCNLVYHCEYINGECREPTVQVGSDQEFDTSGYVNLTRSEICTGVNLVGGVATVTQGTNMEGGGSFHVNQSSCAIDLSVPKRTPLWNGQIPGLGINNETQTLVWEEGYSCVSGSDRGFGTYIDVTQPNNGRVIRYAHLTSDSSCSFVMSGATGNSDPEGHLHVEVLIGAGSTEGCLGRNNPCNYIPGGCHYCDSRPTGVALTNTSPDSQNKKNINLIGRTFAQEQWPDVTPFISDQDIEDGVYSIIYGSGGSTTAFIKTIDNHIVFFEDENGNGVLDEGERILSPYEAKYKYSVSFSKVSEVFRLVLQEGLNLVSFPVIFSDSEGEDVNKASQMIEYLNNGGASITSLAAFREGRFIVYTNRDGKEFGDDFNILPGEGYFVTSLSRGVFLYSGRFVENSLEVLLSTGWNLVNIYNSENQSFSGFDILKQMKNNSIEATTISKWEDGRYSSIVSSEGNRYGQDFRIFPTRGYFVRVQSGEGTFKPN